MDASSPEIYYVPALLSLICIMSAMAFVVAAYHWFWRAMRNSDALNMNFTKSIWRGQLLAFLFVMLMSIFVGVYNFYTMSSPLDIWGELVILGVVLGFKPLIIRQLLSVLLFGLACILGWLVSLIMGAVIYYICGNSLGFLPVLIVGLAWNIPIIWMFLKMSNNYKLNDLGLYKFLWSIALAYMALLIPLTMQQIANSDTWQDMKNAKIIRLA